MTGETEPRPGSGPDLSRRMDRIENRQDGIETEVRNLAIVVNRMEVNQDHATKMSELQYKTLDTAVKTIAADLSGFMKRIESLISGETTLPNQQERLAEWMAFRVKTEKDIDELQAAAQRRGGVLAAFGGIKAAVVVGAAVASPVITILALLLHGSA